MKNIKKQDIVFATVKYTDGTGEKERPCFVIKINFEIVRVFRLTSKFENKSRRIKKQYFEIKDWQDIGLWKKSWIDTVDWYDLSIKENKFRFIGNLTNNDLNRFIEFAKDKVDLFEE